MNTKLRRQRWCGGVDHNTMWRQCLSVFITHLDHLKTKLTRPRKQLRHFLFVKLYWVKYVYISQYMFQHIIDHISCDFRDSSENGGFNVLDLFTLFTFCSLYLYYAYKSPKFYLFTILICKSGSVNFCSYVFIQMRPSNKRQRWGGTVSGSAMIAR